MNNFEQGGYLDKSETIFIDNTKQLADGKVMSEEVFIENFNKNLSWFFEQIPTGTKEVYVEKPMVKL